MRKSAFWGLLLSLLLMGTGDAWAKQAEIYPMSYDQTYQVALEALDGVKFWKVIETDQQAGLIILETGGFFFPRRNAKILVSRLEPFRTKVEFYQGKTPLFYGKFFEAIDRHVNERILTYPN